MAMHHELVVRFTMDGRPFELSRSQVEMSLAGVDPEPVRSHAVEIAGTWYPVKQVLECATGVDRSDFISTAARRQLKKLGFPLRHD
jgi:hypothetical protein